jgi:hypothetical protein
MGSVKMFPPLKGLSIIALLALLDAGPVHAETDTATNCVSTQVRNLLDTTGYTQSQIIRRFAGQNTNSAASFHYFPRGPFAPLVVSAKKTGWNLWDNTSFKSVGREGNQISVLAPSALLAQYEYDITYSFEF